MLATPHILTGAVIGSLFSSWPAVVVIAFLSHYILDAIPHTEVSTFRPIEERKDPNSVKTIDYIIAGIDIVIGFGILIYLLSFRDNYVLVIIGALIASVSDIDNLPIWYRYSCNLPVFKQLYRFHTAIHFDLKTKYWLIGLIVEIIKIGAAIWLLLPRSSSF